MVSCRASDASGYAALVAGHICLDVIPDLTHAGAGQLLPGKLLEIGPARFSTGGSVANTGLALHKLGVPVYLAAKVGADLFGQAIKAIVASFGSHLTEGLTIDARAGTSYTVIIAPPGVDRSFLHYPGANHAFSAGDVPVELFERVRVFHFGYPPLMKRMYADTGAQLVELFQRAKAAGVMTSLDMALPDPATPAGRADWGAILSRVLPCVDLFFPSLEEILYMLRRPLYDKLSQAMPAGANVAAWLKPALLTELGEQILEMGAGLLALKLGESGLYVRSAGEERVASMGRGRPADVTAWADREIWAPCFQVDVAGTTGAGDATIAGFLAGLSRGLSPEETALIAVGVGACCVEAPDALSGIRAWEETRLRIVSGWQQHSLVLHEPGWRYDPARRLWRGPRDCRPTSFSAEET